MQSMMILILAFIAAVCGVSCTSNVGTITSLSGSTYVSNCGAANNCPAPALCTAAGVVVTCSIATLPDVNWTCVATGATPKWYRPSTCPTTPTCTNFAASITTDGTSLATIQNIGSCNTASGGICPPVGCCHYTSDAGSIIKCLDSNMTWGCVTGTESPYFRQLCGSFCSSGIGSLSTGVACSSGNNCPAAGCCEFAAQGGTTVSCDSGNGATVTYTCSTPGGTPTWTPLPPSPNCPSSVGAVGSLYSAALTATGGSGVYSTWAVSSGTFLSVAGSTLSGTPSAAGTVQFTLTVTDSVGAIGTKVCSIVVTAKPTIACRTPALPNGEITVAYASTNVATAAGGSGSGYTYSAVFSPSNPGFTFAAASANISATNTALTTSGSFNINVTVTDSSGGTASVVCPVTVLAAPTVTCPTNTVGYSGVLWQSTGINAAAGTGTGYVLTMAGAVQVNVTGATLPLSIAGLVLSGTPTTTGITLYTYTIRITDSNSGTSTKVCTLLVYPPPNFNCPTVNNVNVNAAYSQTITPTGGNGTFVFTATSANIPPLSVSTGGVVSLAANAVSSPTTITYTVTVTSGGPTTKVCTLNVVAIPQIACPGTGFPTGEQTVVYTNTTLSFNGTGTFTQSGLPAGLTLSSTGVVSGTPTAAGTFSVTFRLTNAAGTVASVVCSIVITPAPVLSCPTSLTTEVGLTYTSAVTVVNGTSPFTFSMTGNPAWLSINATSGAITGVAACAAPPCTNNIRFSVTDAKGATTSINCTLTTYAAFTFACPSRTTAPTSTAINSAVTGLPASTANPITWAISGQAWLSISASGNVSGTTPATAGTYNYTITGTDALGVVISRNCSIVVSAQPVFNACPNYGSVCINTVYTGPAITLSSTGSGGGTFSVNGQPTGLSINPTTGVISGTPTAAGTFTMTIRYTDSNGAVATINCTITVVQVTAGCGVGGGTTLSINAGQAFSIQLQASATPTGTLTFSGLVTNPSVAWLSLSSSGLLTGTAPTTNPCGGTSTAPCSVSVTYTVTSQGCTRNTTCTLNVQNPNITAACPPNLFLWTSTSARNLLFGPINGGTAPYTWNFTVTPATTFTLTYPSPQYANMTITFATAQVFSICYTVTDSLGLVSAQSCCNFNVTAVPTYTCPGPQPTCVAFTYTLVPTGGSGTFSYSRAGSNNTGVFRPANATTNIFSTVATLPVTTTVVRFSVTITDQANTGLVTTATCTLTFQAPSAPTCPSNWVIERNTAILPTVSVATAACTGCTYSISTASVPPGISVAANGTVSGTITNATATSGTVTFQSTAPNGGCARRTCSFTIINQPSLNCPLTNLVLDRGQVWSNTMVRTVNGSTLTFALVGTTPTGSGMTINSTSGVVSLTAAQTSALSLGTLSYTVTMTDNFGFSQTVTCNVTVYPAITVTCPTTTTAFQTVATQLQFGATGAPSFVFTTTSATGFLNGLSVTSATSPGSVTVTPSSSGSFTYTLSVTDGAGQTASRNCSLTVSAAPSITCPSTSAAVIGSVVSSSATSNCASGCVWSLVTPASLTNNLTFSAAGLLSGTVTGTATSFNYTIRVTDSTNAFNSIQCSFRVVTALTATCGTGANSFNVGQTINIPVSVTGGGTPYTYSAVLTGLPAGVTFDVAQGVLRGTASSVTGPFPVAYTYTVTVQDAAGQTQTITCTLNLYAALTVACPATQRLASGASYIGLATATGGRTPYTWSLPSSPASWTTFGVNSSGAVTGTGAPAGTSQFTVRAVDANSNSITSGLCSIIVNSPLTLACPRLTADVGLAYSSAAVATGGNTSSYAFSGTLPSGFSIGASTGLVTGTFSASGTFAFTITVNDGVATPVTVTCSIAVANQPTIACPTWTTSEVQLSAPATAAAGFTSTGGTAPIAFSVSAGLAALQNAGLTFNATSGRFSGTLTASGTFNYTGTVTDALTATASINCTLTVQPPPALLCPASTAAVSTFYSATLAATGGTPAYTYSVVGVLPTGLTLTGATIQGSPSFVGTFTYQIRVTDSVGVSTTTAMCTLQVSSPGCLSTNQATTIQNGASTCTGCATCKRSANPCFSKQCQLNAVLILDNSASIAPYISSVRSGVLAFVNGIQNIINVGGTCSLGVIQFDTTASKKFDLTPVTPAYATQITTYVNTQYLTTFGNTNWADALNLARTNNWGAPVDVFVIFTDGNPQSCTGPWVCAASCYSVSDPFFSNLCSPAGYCAGPPVQPTGLSFVSTASNELEGLWAACTAADALKATGAKLFLVGVGDVPLNEDEIQVITGTRRWDLQATTFFTSDYVINADYAQLASLFSAVATGLCPCLASYPACTASTTFPTSCTAQLFSARVRVTTRNTISTTFPSFSVTAANIYYSYLGGSSGRVAYEFYNPPAAANTADPVSILRTDILNPCKLQRLVTCGSGCYSVQEKQNLPRFFLEGPDTAGTAGAINSAPAGCTGYTKVYPYPTFPAAIGTSSPETIKYIWVLTSDNVTPCAAEAFDGTFYEFFTGSALTRGVVQIGQTPKILPAATAAFNFAPTGTCTTAACQRPVEMVFVIDEQFQLTTTDFSDIKKFIAQVIFNTNLQGSVFGWAWSNSPYDVNTLTGATVVGTTTNLDNTFISPHAQAKGTTNFASLITNTVNKFWPTATPVSGYPRRLITIVGGPDSVDVAGTDPTGSRWTTLQTLLANKNVEYWSVGVDVGAADPTLLAKMASTNQYVHYSAYQLSSYLLTTAVPDFALRTCPTGNLCGDSCKALCGCASPGTCVCTGTCTQDACSFPRTCTTNNGCFGTSITCSDSNACTSDSCDLKLGCQYTTSVTCDDGSLCTTDTCNSADGTCVYTPVTCTPTDLCTTGSCNSANGNCIYTPLPAGACDDGNACTLDQCFPATGCKNTDISNSCNDGSACTTDSCNPTTGCVYTPVTCNDNNLCTSDSCNPSTGCVYTPITCNDNNLCTADTCSASTGCVYTPTTCSDGNACTADSCDPATGCQYSTITCDDGDPCTIDSCSPQTGCIYTPVACNDNNQCTDDVCDSSSGQCTYTFNPGRCAACGVDPLCSSVLTFNACQDPLCVDVSTTMTCFDPLIPSVSACLSALSGNPPRYCFVAPKPACDDNNACTADTCDTTTGCKYTPITCNDGNACTTDTCSVTTGCVYTPIAPCNDNNPCTIDTCDTTTGCKYTPVVCNDNSACTTDQCSQSLGGQCVYTPITCNDGNACTADSCDTTTGCTYTPITCNDGSVCTTDTCSTTFGCQYTPIAPCNDNLKCTNDQCDPINGCVYTPVQCTPSTNPCQVNQCVEAKGGCTGVAISCNDNNPCTTDTCDPTTVAGCVYTPVACTAPSACEIWACDRTLGRCAFQNNVTCNDGSSCTTDSCIPSTGCAYRNITCPPGATECLFAFGCDGTGSSPVCIFQNVTFLIDFCGVCKGDNTACFFSSLISSAAIGGITGGAVAGIVIAAVAAACIAAWLSKKGYDHYKAKSDLTAAGAHHNPYFKDNEMAGEMVK